MSLSVQFLSLLAMIGTGIVAAAFIDMIGTGTSHAGKRSVFRRRAVFFEIIGWILVGCWTFYILVVVRSGEWRIYDPFAQMSGMLLYASFLHRPFRLFGRILFSIFIKPILLLTHVAITIVGYVIGLAMKVVLFLLRPFIKVFRKYFGKHFKRQVK